MRVRLVLFGSMFVLLGACGNDLPDTDCSGTIPTYEEVTAFSKCATCHSSKVSGAQRNGAPNAVNFDTESAARAAAEAAAREVKAGAMPPAGFGISLSDSEKTALYDWALCN